MLARLTGRSLAEPWIMAGLFGSFSALHGAFLGAFAEPDRKRTLSVAAPLVFAGLVATVAWMVVRPKPLADVAIVGLLATLVGTLGGLGLGVTVPTATARDDDVVIGGFRFVAWLEGTSVVLLMLVGMPFHALTGHRLDGGTGLLGWTHGVLFLVYLQTLASTARRLRWSKPSVVLAVVAALLPGGTFVFERWKAG